MKIRSGFTVGVAAFGLTMAASLAGFGAPVYVAQAASSASCGTTVSQSNGGPQMITSTSCSSPGTPCTQKSVTFGSFGPFTEYICD